MGDDENEAIAGHYERGIRRQMPDPTEKPLADKFFDYDIDVRSKHHAHVTRHEHELGRRQKLRHNPKGKRGGKKMKTCEFCGGGIRQNPKGDKHRCKPH